MDRETSLDGEEEGTCLLRLVEAKWADSLPPWGRQHHHAPRVASSRAGPPATSSSSSSPPPSPLVMRLSSTTRPADDATDVFPRLGSSPRASRTNFGHV